MSEETLGRGPDLVVLSTEIVSAYVSNNPVRPSDLSALLNAVHSALRSVVSGTMPASDGGPSEAVEKPTAAQIRKSVTHAGIVSFLDGKMYKTLKRHLSGHGLDPRSYCQRFGLPTDYPMVAPAYSEARSQLAKNIGLGKPGRLVK